jgi:hypothetical protein
MLYWPSRSPAVDRIVEAYRRLWQNARGALRLSPHLLRSSDHRWSGEPLLLAASQQKDDEKERIEFSRRPVFACRIVIGRVTNLG